jgi:hypothetical protein
MKPPMLVLAIDQGEELFLADAQEEAQPFLKLLHDLLISDPPLLIAVIRCHSGRICRARPSRSD